MLTNRVIPSLLLRRGRLVKGVRYRDHKDAGNPATTARAHNAQGADELMLVDTLASKERRGPDLGTVEKVARECFMPLTVGGGISSLDIAYQCMERGADKLMVTMTAFDDPALISDLAKVFGCQAIVLGIDVIEHDGRYQIYDHRTGEAVSHTDLSSWLEEAVSRGAGEIRVMAVNSEGIRHGMNIPLYTYIADRVSIPIVLEGGAGTLEDLKAAINAGVDALALGTMLVFSDNNIIKVKRYLANAGAHMRI